MNPIIAIALIAILLAFLAGVIHQRKSGARDILRAARIAADQQAQTTSHLYSSLLVINGYEIDMQNRVRPRKYPQRKVQEATRFLQDIGLLQKGS